MQLNSVTFQGSQPPDEPFSQLYWQAFGEEGSKEFREMVQALFALLEHLAANVIAPPQWVCVSVGRLVFQNVDQQVYGEEMPPHGRVTLRIDYRWYVGSNKYAIQWFLPTGGSWDHIVGYASTVEEAGKLVVEALNTPDN